MQWWVSMPTLINWRAEHLEGLLHANCVVSLLTLLKKWFRMLMVIMPLLN